MENTMITPNQPTVSFNDLVYKASRNLRVPAMKFTQNSDDANDLIQETILKALKNRNKFKAGTNIKAWLYIIMKNTYISGYHISKRSSNMEMEESHLAAKSSVIDYNSGISNINTDYINNAIEKLDKTFRVPFMMHYEGFKYEEIAQHLNIPMGTVKNRIHVAKQNLMTSLKDFKN